jgi:uncharacterized DUF497 family protein
MAIFRLVYTWRGEGMIPTISAEKASENEREISKDAGEKRSGRTPQRLHWR